MTQPDEPTAAGREELLERLAAFVRDKLLDGQDDVELTASSPLLEWGVLNSMNTALLLSYVRDSLGIAVPPSSITGRHFRDLNSICDLLISLQPAGRG
jgi:acyl carrier protein